MLPVNASADPVVEAAGAVVAPAVCATAATAPIVVVVDPLLTPVSRAVVDVVELDDDAAVVVVAPPGTRGRKLVEQLALPATTFTTTVSPYGADPVLNPTEPCPFASVVVVLVLSTVW